MRSLLSGLFFMGILSLVTIASAQNADKRIETNGKPDVIAIKFHADWCGTCRRMGSVFEDLTTVAEEEPVLFTRLDLTDSSSRKQARYLMTTLGLNEVWQASGAGEKTGFILLVDAGSKKVVGRLTAEQDLKQMKANLLDVVAKNRG
jgi:thiol-disulfide isomerase/thioredoxin